MNISGGIERLSFLFVLDDSKIDEIFDKSNTPSDYNKQLIVDAVVDLRILCDNFGLWLYNESLIYCKYI